MKSLDPNQHHIDAPNRQPTVENTTLAQRANELQTYLDLLPCEPLLLPLAEGCKQPIIKGRIDLDTADRLLVSGSEAVSQLQNGQSDGFCIYAGRESHNTQNLVFTDHDDPDRFHPDTLPDTLLAQSGSGTGFHQTYINAGDVSNSRAMGDLEKAGEIRAHNWYIVTPGSAHPSGGIYHLLNDHPPTKLSTDDLRPELQPNTCDGKNPDDLPVTGDETDQLSKQIGQEAVDIAQTYLDEFKSRSPAAFSCLMDRLNGGRGSYQSKLSREGDTTKIDRDLQEKTVLTHLFGIFKQATGSADRARELAYHTLSYYCVNSNNKYTKDGEPRKWLKRDNTYRSNQLNHAIKQFDPVEFTKFCNQSSEIETRDKLRYNKYSDPTQGLAHFMIYYCSNYFQVNDFEKDPHTILHDSFNYAMEPEEFQALQASICTTSPMYTDTPGSLGCGQMGVDRLYPTKSGVSELCARVDSAYKGISKTSFDRCLANLQSDGGCRIAQIEQGVDYRIYPAEYPDPPQANWVKIGGRKIEPELTC